MNLAGKAAILGLMAASVIGLAGCGGEKTEEKAAAPQGNLIQKVKEKGTLVMGTSSGFPPYEFIDTSKSDKTVVGIDVALGQKLPISSASSWWCRI